MAIISGRGGAPGSFIYEGAIASQGGRASFNTVYMMVDAPEESSILEFPYNRPIAISSLNEYENLLGTLPTAGGLSLTSYYAVKAFFQQAAVADLRVTRVGTPSVIREVSFNPGANKDNGITAPSAMEKGDLVYVKLEINGIRLGDFTVNGSWLGVPVEIPVNYIAGDIDNNLAISRAMRDAVAAAIEGNADISAGTYIRELGQGDPSCDECAYIYLTGRVFNAPIEIVENLQITGNQFILSSAGYTIQGITESTKSVYDWVQAARTAFEDPKLSQGYLCAPAAFSYYNQADRVNLGQTMEEVSSDSDHKWMAMIDCGPYFVTSIVDYKDYLEHEAADGFEENGQYLIENVIYKWTDPNPLNFTSAKYDEKSAARSANSNLSDGDRRALRDSKIVYVQTPADTANDVLTLTTEWPEKILSGELADISLFYADPTSPTAPTYNDLPTGASNADLVGSFYVIASDVDPSLEANQIKLATSRTRALANEPVNLVTGGTPQGGGLLDIEYATASWEFNVRIKGEESNLIEVNNNMGASFNTKHFPGTLQKATEKYDFKAVVRQLTDPSSAIGIGGASTNYYGSAQISTTADTIVISDHGLNTRDLIFVQELPGSTRFTLDPLGAIATVALGSGSGDYVNGTYTNVEIKQGSGYGATATVVVAGNDVTSITIEEGGTNYIASEAIRLPKTVIGGTSNYDCTVATIGAPDPFPALFAIKVDNNTIQLAGSEEAADAGTALSIGSIGTDGNIKTPLGAAAQGVITTGGDALFCVADHGLKTAERILFDGNIEGTTTRLVKGTTDTSSTLYYVHVEDRNFFRLTASASNLAAEAFMNFPFADGGIVTSSPVRFYRKLASTLSGGSFNDAGIQRFLRGRKYQMDATMAVFTVKDEVGGKINTGLPNPYGGLYADDLTTNIRLSASLTPESVKEYALAAASFDAAADTVAVPSHGYVVGQKVILGTSVGATLAAGLEEDLTYFAIVVDANTLKLAATAADAVAGTAVDITDAGTDNTAGVQAVLTLDSNPYAFTYTEDEDANPLNFARDIAGDNNFYCVPLSTGDQANSTLVGTQAHLAIEDSSAVTCLFGAQTELEFVEPQAEVPNNLWNFDAVTSGDLIAEALRGVNNNGTPQAIVIETGMDNHNRLFAESQKYSTTQGFLAYFAPYILNDVGVYIPPTPYVTGLAMRRYRDEVAGFRLPPAGAKYSLAGARGVQVEITTGMQDVSNPYGLNALRQLPGYSQVDPDTGETYGPVFVWGSRTRINPANAEHALYKFVNTRVILNVIYGTLDGALDGQIFNIIDGRAVTFNQIRTLLTNVLYSQFFVPGALFGATASDAFEVVVDDRNNPAANLENGLVNVQIFVVPVPTLERIEIDLLRVNIGGIDDAKMQLNLQ